MRLWWFKSLKGEIPYRRILMGFRRGLEILQIFYNGCRWILFQEIDYPSNSLAFRLSLDPRNGRQLLGV